ncbi:hypothetical protein VB776_10700 [Arcicella sp. DC2W]|uniref:Uncharacterized protein n=1 Tax=Arcicella gelida TaxID=2984195 RepID=A0ABU5S4J9_9BACT|nr:hypothetical protein [Arcicella sp. DC2W]MEA5403387.1 hypothetical protein [Arcicella sp. DC2W]
MSVEDIREFLNAGPNWHSRGTFKTDFLKQFSKELRGDTNADFYIDKISPLLVFFHQQHDCLVLK